MGPSSPAKIVFSRHKMHTIFVAFFMVMSPQKVSHGILPWKYPLIFHVLSSTQRAVLASHFEHFHTMSRS